MKNKFFILKYPAPYYVVASFLLGFNIQNTNAQLANASRIKVSNGTMMSVHFDFVNKASSRIVNDGELYIFNDWRNDGKVDFTPAYQGTTTFMGDQEQIINGNASGLTGTKFKNVIFDNTSSPVPFTLASDIAVFGNADFIKGIIEADTNEGKMIFAENADHSNCSNDSFVDGEVQKIGTSIFIYPVGDNQYYRPNSIGESNFTTDSYTAQYFLKNSNLDYPHANKQNEITIINDKEYWNVTKESGSTLVALTLTLNDATTPSLFSNPTTGSTTVQIVRWDDITSKWVTQGGIMDVGHTMITAPITGYGIFTLALVKEKVDEDLVFYNGLSPNGDGKNEFFYIKGINKFPDNSVEIYNRWGVLVYSAKGYNESDKVFNGYSEGYLTLDSSKKLPMGTYFYILNYKKDAKKIKRTGYLYINN
ncbi:gliding motility-associated C-terminal domain-containing protein [Flavobacterium sp. '19STA2R22 D10 B1']|uniref:gliding motility-associated C-terminal domain-containing protein n=1 Tax=Flavobacterium aerium TaxID=3037261 RepID=UPI00278C0B28|nr:gliding motility-associated C-terminal domain-containing protein [Flavobacterium sp. '19STA2R22 D10 B1']